MSHLLERTCFYSEIFPSALEQRESDQRYCSLGDWPREDTVSALDRQRGSCAGPPTTSHELLLVTAPISLKCIIETDLLKIAFESNSSVLYSIRKDGVFCE